MTIMYRRYRNSIMLLILLSKVCCNNVTTLSYIRKCVASVSLQSHNAASDYITLIMVYITCIIYGSINDSPILVIHTCIYVHCHITPISEIMVTTVDIYTYLIMEHYFM